MACPADDAGPQPPPPAPRAAPAAAAAAAPYAAAAAGPAAAVAAASAAPDESPELDPDLPPPVTTAQLLACSVDAWADLPALARAVLPARLLRVPPGVAEWLLHDGVYLPDASEALPTRGRIDAYAVRGVDYTDDWSSSCASSSSSDDGNAPADDAADAGGAAAAEDGAGAAGPPAAAAAADLAQDVVEGLAEFESAIKSAIEALGGAVMPKLNWSAPKDAAWVSQHASLQCHNPSEVLLLLKSSDRVAFDLADALPSCSDADADRAPDGAVGAAGPAPAGSAPDAAPGAAPGAAPVPAVGAAVRPAPPGGWVLALRPWRALRPEGELRCFVAGGELIAVSQRDVTECFAPALQPRRRALAETLIDFHERVMRAGAPAGLGPDYVYDVYVANAAASARAPSFSGAAGAAGAAAPRPRVWLLDINPFGGTTQPLLYSWSELRARAADQEGSRFYRPTPAGPARVVSAAGAAGGAAEGHGVGAGAAEGAHRGREGGYVGASDSDRSYASSSDDGVGDEELVRIVRGGPGGGHHNQQRFPDLFPGTKALSGAPLDLVSLAPGGAIDDLVGRLRREALAQGRPGVAP